jgi:hypothetical protein
MPHFPKPFFRSTRSAWYVQIGTRQVKLGAGRDAAFKRYHELMSEPVTAVTAPPQVPPDQLVVVIVDEYLDWCQKHRSPDTYRWYKDRLDDFCQAITAELTVDRLKPHHVQKWVDARNGLASGSRRNLIAAVKRALNWAEEQGYVARSPLAHMRKPGCGRKGQIVSDAEFRAILDHTKDQQFRDLLRPELHLRTCRLVGGRSGDPDLLEEVARKGSSPAPAEDDLEHLRLLLARDARPRLDAAYDKSCVSRRHAATLSGRVAAAAKRRVFLNLQLPACP